jgi:probable HAF family extracellular repeat protein
MNYNFTDLPNLGHVLDAPTILGPKKITGQFTVRQDNGNATNSLLTDDDGHVSIGPVPVGSRDTFVNGLYVGGTSSTGVSVACTYNATDTETLYTIANGIATPVAGGPTIYHNCVYGINAHGAIIGSTMDGSVLRPFLFQDGKLTYLSAPGAIHLPFVSLGGFANAPPPKQQTSDLTSALAINDQGTVVGMFTGADNKLHGFVYSQSGNYTVINVPGSIQTAVTGIANDGTLIGFYTSASGQESNFMASPSGYPALGNQIDPWGNVTLFDVTTGQAAVLANDAYTGPVGGLTSQFINITKDNINLTAQVPNTFLHSGSGDDALNVSACNGNNILDGGTGSNFLVGGSGNDTFFTDDRNPAADIWSTLVNFHAGDTATVWGVTANDFATSLVDNQGAAGYKGLTLHITAADRPTASVTLTGYSTADIGQRLSISYGVSPDTPGLAGSTYMAITAH